MLGPSARGPHCGGVSSNFDPGSDMLSGSQEGKPMLFVWLDLLGWQVTVEPDVEQLVGLAPHCGSDGSTTRAGACARTRDALALPLFEGAMNAVEARRRS